MSETTSERPSDNIRKVISATFSSKDPNQSTVVAVEIIQDLESQLSELEGENKRMKDAFQSCNNSVVECMVRFTSVKCYVTQLESQLSQTQLISENMAEALQKFHTLVDEIIFDAGDPRYGKWKHWQTCAQRITDEASVAWTEFKENK